MSRSSKDSLEQEEISRNGALLAVQIAPIEVEASIASKALQ